MKTRLLGGIAALVVAVIGTIILFNYVQGADKRALANTETTDVLVVKQDVAAGTPADKLGDYVVTKSVPVGAVAADRVADLASLGNKVTSVALVPGEQLLNSRLVEANAYLGPARVKVPAGLQEITFRLGIDRVVGGRVEAGDTVGIFISATGDSSATTSGQPAAGNATQLVFHKVLVTGVQFSSGAAAQTEAQAQQNSSQGALTADNQKQNSGDTYLITFARNAADAEKLVYAAEFGKIYLSREPADAIENSTGVLDKTRLFR
ncbi:Flp pilus assembly protein CpaB [Arthrobacter sp. TB 26]|uniref:Flp pilus assembly protein CpaB n=1 Tax=Arthrobacter sp. TB 26 TaxID=494420 RepID=UPI000462CE9A|nr:RcpC/CpaB family pilus assembly protein [Arthrobacter sp. TB 26]